MGECFGTSEEKRQQIRRQKDRIDRMKRVRSISDVSYLFIFLNEQNKLRGTYSDDILSK